MKVDVSCIFGNGQPSSLNPHSCFSHIFSVNLGEGNFTAIFGTMSHVENEAAYVKWKAYLESE